MPTLLSCHHYGPAPTRSRLRPSHLSHCPAQCLAALRRQTLRSTGWNIHPEP